MRKRKNRKYKFVFAISYRRGGGAERAISQLAGAVADLGHDVTMVQRVVTEDDYDLDPRVRHIVVDPVPGFDPPEDPKLRHVPQPFRYILRHGYFALMASPVRGVTEHLYIRNHWMQDIGKTIRRQKADFVVPMLGEMEALAFAYTRFSKSRCVETIRCNPKKHPKSMIHRFARNIYDTFAEGVYVQNEGEAEYFPGFMQKRIFVIPNITDEVFTKISVPPKEEIKRFITAGRLVDQKNHEMLIRAFTDAVRSTENESAALEIYGDGELEKKLKRLVRKLGMEDRIFVLGRTKDLPEKYAASDAFVLSSDFEGQPNALMEAMFAGLPCISTDCPDGPSDLIEDGVSGLLVPVGDQEAMRDALVFMMKHPVQANDMGRKAKAFMTENFNAKAIAQRFVDECAALKNRFI